MNRCVTRLSTSFRYLLLTTEQWNKARQRHINPPSYIEYFLIPNENTYSLLLQILSHFSLQRKSIFPPTSYSNENTYPTSPPIQKPYFHPTSFSNSSPAFKNPPLKPTNTLTHRHKRTQQAMAPKGGGLGFGIASGNRAPPDPSKVPIITSGGNLSHNTSQLMMCMVVVPALWYLLDDARMTEAVRWAVGKIVGVRAVEGEVVEDEEGEVVDCDGKMGADAAMCGNSHVIERMEGTEERVR